MPASYPTIPARSRLLDMDESKLQRPKADDVPIIGDYSERQNARLRATGAPAAAAARAPRAESQRSDERVLLDPRDVRRYRQRAGERQRKGPLAQFLRYVPLVVILAIAVLVYSNLDSLRGMTIGFSLPASRGISLRGEGDGAAGAGGESAAVAVEAPVVVGDEAALHPEAGANDVTPEPDAATAAPPAEADEPPRQTDATSPADTDAPPPPDTAAPADDSSVARHPSRPDDASVVSGGAAVEPPEAPAEPERFEFGGSLQTVSESDASAAVLVLRSGGRRAAASITWWTTNGTATAGIDYADLGEVVLPFPAGAQNRTIRVPIVGDRVAEGPENFYVHFTTGDPAFEPRRIEVVINDDD
jgi:hypothetical protein